MIVERFMEPEIFLEMAAALWKKYPQNKPYNYIKCSVGEDGPDQCFVLQKPRSGGLLYTEMKVCEFVDGRFIGEIYHHNEVVAWCRKEELHQLLMACNQIFGTESPEMTS